MLDYAWQTPLSFPVNGYLCGPHSALTEEVPCLNLSCFHASRTDTYCACDNYINVTASSSVAQMITADQEKQSRFFFLQKKQINSKCTKNKRRIKIWCIGTSRQQREPECGGGFNPRETLLHRNSPLRLKWRQPPSHQPAPTSTKLFCAREDVLLRRYLTDRAASMHKLYSCTVAAGSQQLVIERPCAWFSRSVWVGAAALSFWFVGNLKTLFH